MKTKASFLSVLALTMSFAGIAAAQEPPPAGFAPPPPPAGAGPAFGNPGQLVISDDLRAGLLYSSLSEGDASVTDLQLQPAVDYFVIPNLSVGGQLAIRYTTQDDGAGGSLDTTSVGILPRVGYNIPLGPSASIWPRVALGYVHASASTGVAGAPSVSGYSIVMEAFVPFLFHPVPHFFIGGGPILSTELAAKVEDADVPKTTNIGLVSTIGGYFGGM
jgi:hypothetical protein